MSADSLADNSLFIDTPEDEFPGIEDKDESSNEEEEYECDGGNNSQRSPGLSSPLRRSLRLTGYYALIWRVMIKQWRAMNNDCLGLFACGNGKNTVGSLFRAYIDGKA
jgi:hypothetical protein